MRVVMPSIPIGMKLWTCASFFWRDRNYLYLFLCEYFRRTRLILAGTQMSFIEHTYSDKKIRLIDLLSYDCVSVIGSVVSSCVGGCS